MHPQLIRQFLGGGDDEVSPLDAMLDRSDQKVLGLSDLVKPGEDSAEREKFFGPISSSNHFMRQMSIRRKMTLLPTMIRLTRTMARGDDYYTEAGVPVRDVVDPAFLNEVEGLALSMGATTIGYARIPRNFIFAGKAIPYDGAIVFAVEMDKDRIDKAPSYDTMVQVVKSYGHLGSIANAITDLLRGDGFGAYPGTAVGGLVDYARVSELAGLGAIGYHGMLVSPPAGTRQRINLVYTNILNLPPVEENPQLWVRNFCVMCGRCIRECPPGAIFPEPAGREGGRMTCVDHDTCLAEFATQYGCAVCIKVCPFSYAGYEVIRSRFKGTKHLTPG